MLKYVKVDSDGYAYIVAEDCGKLHRFGYAVGRANDEWLLYSIRKRGNATTMDAILFETTDHVLFDNYLKLILED